MSLAAFRWSVLEPAGGVERAAQLVAHRRRHGGEPLVGGQLVEPVGGLGGQQPGGVADELPVLPVHAPEQVLGPLVVDPAEVHGDLAQRQQRLRQVGHDGERLHGLHGCRR
jgi:hypothetical protein